MMQAIVYEKYGDEKVLELKKDVKKPEAGPKDLLIKVVAAGVNPVDWKLREGYIKDWPQQAPFIPGWDVAGVVEAVGKDAGNKFKKGDEVYAYNRPEFEKDPTDKIGMNGCYAEFVAVPVHRVAHKPKSVDVVTASGIPLAGLTAWQGLFRHGGLKAGQTVLILGGSGGVGGFAVQFAKAHGIKTIATASQKNFGYVKDLGADHVVDYNADIIAEVKKLGAKVDVVYDTVGGESAEKAAPLSQLIVSNAHWGLGPIAAKHGGKAVAFLVAPSSEELAEIAALVDKGAVKLPIVHKFPLAEVRQAQVMSQSGHTQGKIVLVVGKH